MRGDALGRVWKKSQRSVLRLIFFPMGCEMAPGGMPIMHGARDENVPGRRRLGRAPPGLEQLWCHAARWRAAPRPRGGAAG